MLLDPSSSSTSKPDDQPDDQPTSDPSPTCSPALTTIEPRRGYHKRISLDGLAIPLFLSAHYFARYLVAHGNERSLVTIATHNAAKRRRPPSGVECDACAGGHNSACFMPTICDCLCKP